MPGRYSAVRAAKPARRPVARLVPLVAVPTVLALLWTGVSTPSRAEDAVSRSRSELQTLKKEIEANRKAIETLKAKEKDLSRLADRIRRDRELTRRYLEELRGEEDSLRSGLADRQASLLDKEVAARDVAERLKRGIVRYYKAREVAAPELLFSARTFGELFARAQFLGRFIGRQRIELTVLAEERREIAEDASTLEERRRRVEALAAEKKREEARLQARGTAAREEMADLRDERSARERRAKELEASQAAIRRMIDALEKERERSRARGEAPTFAGSLGHGKGKLPWPVEGKVIGDFGLEVNPRYGTRVPSNGIDIAAAEGAAVRAVGPGLVEYVDWLPGYGRTVILNHGSGYYTLYAHASRVEVRRGERVTAGQIIARVGDTDSVKGTCLHFEIRLGDDALDPRQWLR